ncbi:MAG: helix-turn-helix transcriptional regulator [Kangiellaceae bacterium]|nr:helix-turn-helix transcriptional regulator [Kangiellaceae bacterium]
MNSKEKLFSRKSAPSKTARMVETIIGCKWSITVYHLIDNGIIRPGEMVRSVEGLTTKVLNSCLKKNLDYGILRKNIFNETPPRVEYEVTKFGEKFILVLDQLQTLQIQIDNQT